MKNKKGFTLVELLVVMVILIMLLLVAFPNFSRLSNQSRNKYDNTVCVLIKSAASMYVNNKPEEFNTGTTTKTIGDLINAGYLDSDIKDSKGTRVDRTDTVKITKTVSGGITEYTYECPQKLSN